MIWHNGRSGGHYAFVGILPEQGRGLVVLTNTSHFGDEFSVSLLLGNPKIPEHSPNWIWLGFTLFSLIAAPYGLYNFRGRAAETVHGLAKYPRNRIHAIKAVISSAFFMTLIWKIGGWMDAPLVLWGLSLILCIAFVLTSIPAVAKLPWSSVGSSEGRVSSLASLAFPTLILLWVALRL
jgi:hypothetical protein